MAKKNRQRRSAPNAGKSSAEQAEKNLWPIIIGVIGVLAAAGIVILIISRNNQGSPASVASNTNCTPGNGQLITTASGLQYEDLEICTGTPTKNGDRVTVHYQGTLPNGTEFDSSFKSGQPFTFTLGEGGVIKGWDEGVLGMTVGSKRKLIIPPELGYGAQGAGELIPPNSTLHFTVQVMNINQ